MISTLLLLSAISAGDPSPADLEFFEKEVRPILANRCQSCHGEEKQKGDLRLDSRAAALAGGKAGPAVVPGKPDESVLVEAINYGDLVQMPPKSKLPPKEIAALTKWVEIGAPWPEGAKSGGVPKPKDKVFDLRERAKHWSFLPIRRVEPPAVRDASWPGSPIDRFLLAALEAKGLRPAPDCDKNTLLRRATFDLTGLPPSRAEVAAFLADDAPDAYERVVDRLLASPHYGERWGRHWLDLVRFAETSGHEFDYDIPGAWRYRDYVVRAFNDDLPYDRFLTEHVAGDLVPDPRRNPTDGLNESIVATGFYFLGEGVHSPVDVRDDEILRIDNQIDVLSKTFLGLTVSCARCHDHKFDAIATKDYYALAGYLQSSRHQHAFLDPPERIGGKIAELEALKGRIASAGLGLREGDRTGPYFEAAKGILASPPGDGPGRLVESEAKRSGLDEERLALWVRAIERADAGTARPDEPPSNLFESFDRSDFGDWTATGDAFGRSPSRRGSIQIGAEGPRPVAGGVAHSGLVSDRLQGVLRSPTFPIERGNVHLRAWGRSGRINVIVDGFEKIREPIYGGLTKGVDSEEPGWITLDVSMWKGHRAYIELGDGGTLDYSGPTTRGARGDGYLAVDEIRFSDGPAPTSQPIASKLADLDASLARWRSGADPLDAEVVAFAMSRGLLDRDGSTVSPLVALHREIEAAIPEPILAPAILDGSAEDERVHIRGSAKSLGEVVPRRFLEAIAGDGQPAPASGSGRLELAKRMLDPSCPQTARVMVNRIWKGHFGAGLVKTPDDFGAMGEPPSHPELLDWLASEFRDRGWSIKAMHRAMVLSRAYRMSSRIEPEAEAADPGNRLLHRMGVRRLEAEGVRDAMLFVSGRLDPRLGGPSVPPHLTSFMDGRGRPGRSGPLDGDGRRSLYLNVRRNFLSPMLLAFDFPAPASTMGRRNVSNVPAQALTLLNDPFCLGQAKAWAERLLADRHETRDGRIAAAYLDAFGRPPSEGERAGASEYLAAQADPDGIEAWTSLAHVLFNVKEFVFVP